VDVKKGPPYVWNWGPQEPIKLEKLIKTFSPWLKVFWPSLTFKKIPK